MRLVLDTDVMVAAILSDLGASRRLLVAALHREFQMLVSTSLLIEYEAVMTRPRHLAASRLSEGDVAVLLDSVAASTVPVRLAFHWRPLLRDPDDDMVLETAINGQADAIVTFNVRDFAATGDRFGVAILRPGDAVREMEAK
jgi:putative PIN family toxin of toxin-antitoxin system